MAIPAGKDRVLDKSLEVVVLAAGQGTRMRSALPKVLHTLAGRPLLAHVLATVAELGPARAHVVIGHGGRAVRERLEACPLPLNWVEQAEQKGTAHAVSQALPDVDPEAIVLVTYGDVPLVSIDTLARCVQTAATGALAIVTAEFQEPGQLGRIVRDEKGRVRAIVEYADASPEERAIREINSGILALHAPLMQTLVAAVEPHNAQGEYYLTDLVALAVEEGLPVEAVSAATATEVMGINDRVELARAERLFQARESERLMRAGVSIADPARLDVRGRVTAGQDCFVDIDVVLEGEVLLGDNVRIGPGCVIRDSILGKGVVVEPHTLIDGARVADGCVLGPFARIRPGSEFAEGVRIGNFVETKKAVLGPGTKANHLAYLGDATLGAGCNVGAGTVTCNYDGIDKHPTTIGDRVFIGTNSTLVAPINIGSDAFVAAGSTVTTPVPESGLAVGRGRQRNIEGWTRPDRRNKQDNG